MHSLLPCLLGCLLMLQVAPVQSRADDPGVEELRRQALREIQARLQLMPQLESSSPVAHELQAVLGEAVDDIVQEIWTKAPLPDRWQKPLTPAQVATAKFIADECPASCLAEPARQLLDIDLREPVDRRVLESAKVVQGKALTEEQRRILFGLTFGAPAAKTPAAGEATALLRADAERRNADGVRGKGSSAEPVAKPVDFRSLKFKERLLHLRDLYRTGWEAHEQAVAAFRAKYQFGAATLAGLIEVERQCADFELDLAQSTTERTAALEKLVRMLRTNEEAVRALAANGGRGGDQADMLRATSERILAEQRWIRELLMQKQEVARNAGHETAAGQIWTNAALEANWTKPLSASQIAAAKMLAEKYAATESGARAALLLRIHTDEPRARLVLDSAKIKDGADLSEMQVELLDGLLSQFPGTPTAATARVLLRTKQRQQDAEALKEAFRQAPLGAEATQSVVRAQANRLNPEALRARKKHLNAGVIGNYEALVKYNMQKYMFGSQTLDQVLYADSLLANSQFDHAQSSEERTAALQRLVAATWSLEQKVAALMREGSMGGGAAEVAIATSARVRAELRLIREVIDQERRDPALVQQREKVAADRWKQSGLNLQMPLPLSAKQLAAVQSLADSFSDQKHGILACRLLYRHQHHQATPPNLEVAVDPSEPGTAPAAKAGMDFSKLTAVQLRYRLAELQKEELEALQNMLNAVMAQYKFGTVTLDVLIQAEQRLMEHQLSFERDPQERRIALERLVSGLRNLEQHVLALQRAGAIGGHPVDLALTSAKRLGAEVRLTEELLAQAEAQSVSPAAPVNGEKCANSQPACVCCPMHRRWKAVWYVPSRKQVTVLRALGKCRFRGVAPDPL